MHSLVRRFIKTAIGFLLAGLLTGGWMLARLKGKPEDKGKKTSGTRSKT